jgi:hypothetical protein
MTFSIQQIGNFPQFFKDEIANLFYVAWIAFYGACMIILIQFKKSPEKLDAMLPTKLPTNDHPYSKPYAVRADDKANMGMLTYLFSYESDFPYNLKTGIEMMDGYLFFLGGMGSYLYASHRNALKSFIELFDVDNYFVDLFCFYLLPTILFYIVLMPLIPIISFCGINFISCFYQPRLQKAYLYAFAWIFNILDYNSIKAIMDISQFPQNFFSYGISVMMGFIMSFMLVPGFSLLYSLAVWIYVIGFVKLMPFVLVYLGDLSWKELGSKILEQFGKHYVGLTVLFLFYSISIAYKNLNQQVAWGTQLGIIVLIMLLLKIIAFLKNVYYYYTGDISTFPNPLDIIVDTPEKTS